MPEPLTQTEAMPGEGRPFPWFCPRCRRKEVRRTSIKYQCQRLFNDRPIAVIVDNLAVPKCGNCGELVFDYLAEEQINKAFQNQTAGLAGRPLVPGLLSDPSSALP